MPGALAVHRSEHGYSDQALATSDGLPLERLADLIPDYFTASGSAGPKLRLIDDKDPRLRAAG